MNKNTGAFIVNYQQDEKPLMCYYKSYSRWRNSAKYHNCTVAHLLLVYLYVVFNYFILLDPFEKLVFIK